MATEQTEDRRNAIADAAIQVLGTAGARGLTHRAVDRAAGLPSSSTSYYCSTRSGLLTLTAERLTYHEGMAVASAIERHSPGTPDPISLLASILSAWTTDSSVVASRARFELFLLAREYPILLDLMQKIRSRFVELVSTIVLDRSDAPFVVAALDGILFADITLGSAALTPEQALASVEPLRGMLASSL